jgi:SAM-dependent methyltransferase
MTTDPFALFRDKWDEIPVGQKRLVSSDLDRLSDVELSSLWKDGTSFSFERRIWRYVLYKDAFKGKRVLDVGSAIGADAMTFAEAGADVTCLDLQASSLKLIDRLARFRSLSIKTVLLEDYNSIDALPGPFDVIWCSGSLICAPYDIAVEESRRLLQHLPAGGRWMELCYPEERWQRDGRPPLEAWGKMTDGERTPWMEWYDLPKLLDRLAPARFDVVLAFNYHNDDFNWFDLQRKP